MNTTQNNTARIIDLCCEYYELREKAAELLTEAHRIRDKVLYLAGPGRYKNYTIFKVKKAVIEVRAYTRHPYIGIRRSKATV